MDGNTAPDAAGQHGGAGALCGPRGCRARPPGPGGATGGGGGLGGARGWGGPAGGGGPGRGDGGGGAGTGVRGRVRGEPEAGGWVWRVGGRDTGPARQGGPTDAGTCHTP